MEYISEKRRVLHFSKPRTNMSMAPRACSVTRTIPFALQAGSKVLQESVAPLWSKAGSLPIQYGNRTLDPTHPCQQACFITELLKPSLANATVVDILQLQNTTHYNVKVLSQCKIEVEVIEVTHTVQIRIPISTITQGGNVSDSVEIPKLQLIYRTYANTD